MNSHSAKCRSVVAKHSYQLLQLFRELVGFYDKACNLYANLVNSANEILSIVRASGYPAVGGPYRYRGALSMYDPKLSVRILIKHTGQFNKAKENMPLLLDGIRSIQEKMTQLKNQIHTLVEASCPRSQVHEFLQDKCPMYPVSVQEHLELLEILQSLVASKFGTLIQSHSSFHKVKIEDLIVPRDIPALEKFVEQLSSDVNTWSPLTSVLKDELIVASRTLADATVSQHTRSTMTPDMAESSVAMELPMSFKTNVTKLQNLTLRITNVGLIPWLESA